MDLLMAFLSIISVVLVTARWWGHESLTPQTLQLFYDLDSLISWNIYRCCMSLMRSGALAEARGVMKEFEHILVPPVARGLSRKALKYTLLAPLYRLRRK